MCKHPFNMLTRRPCRRSPTVTVYYVQHCVVLFSVVRTLHDVHTLDTLTPNHCHCSRVFACTPDGRHCSTWDTATERKSLLCAHDARHVPDTWCPFQTDTRPEHDCTVHKCIPCTRTVDTRRRARTRTSTPTGRVQRGWPARAGPVVWWTCARSMHTYIHRVQMNVIVQILLWPHTLAQIIRH
jgi:hypothetical protein